VNPFFTSKSGKSEKLKIGMTKLIWDVTFFFEGGVGWLNLCHWQPSEMIFTILLSRRVGDEVGWVGSLSPCGGNNLCWRCAVARPSNKSAAAGSGSD
jgi:hypothetical protein